MRGCGKPWPDPDTIHTASTSATGAQGCILAISQPLNILSAQKDDRALHTQSIIVIAAVLRPGACYYGLPLPFRSPASTISVLVAFLRIYSSISISDPLMALSPHCSCHGVTGKSLPVFQSQRAILHFGRPQAGTTRSSNRRQLVTFAAKKVSAVCSEYLATTPTAIS